MSAELPQWKRDFIEFLVRCDALRFGSFVTKSGRPTPFFINTGVFDDGPRLQRLGGFYAEAIAEHFAGGYDLLFGPAYKGIPLVVAAAMHARAPFAFNRKEAKDHGEGGLIVGRVPRDGDRIVIVEDVTTAGTSVRESVSLLRRVARVNVVGLVVSVDRQERGRGTKSALAELEDMFGLKAVALATLDEIVAQLHRRELDGKVVLDDAARAAIDAYRAEYGSSSPGSRPTV